MIIITTTMTARPLVARKARTQTTFDLWSSIKKLSKLS